MDVPLTLPQPGLALPSPGKRTKHSWHLAGSILLYPVLPGGRTFDRNLPGGQALLMNADATVRSVKPDRDGRAIVDGKDLFDPSQPFWGGRIPEIYEPAR